MPGYIACDERMGKSIGKGEKNDKQRRNFLDDEGREQ